jgi:hypothetical protein
MKTTMIALLAGIALTAPAMAQERWYYLEPGSIDHIDHYKCRPLSEAFLTPGIKTPEDAARNNRAYNDPMQLDPISSENIVVYRSLLHGRKDTFFRRRSDCEQMIRMIHKQFP